jgi:two-component system, cell cycle response regulator DivK
MSSTVLYIEDNPDNLQLVERALKAKGYEVLKALNGLTGIQAAEGSNPDLILLDINLPDIDGYEVARRLRGSNNPHMLTVPIIAVTANALKGDAEKALEAGCDFYMSKPINVRELWMRVETYLPK